MQEFRVKCGDWGVGVLPRKTTAVNPEPVLIPQLNGSIEPSGRGMDVSSGP